MGLFNKNKGLRFDHISGEELLPGEILVGERYNHSPENYEVPKAETPEEAAGLALTATMVFSGIDADMYRAEGLSAEEITKTRQFSFECKLELFGWKSEWGDKPLLVDIESPKPVS